VALTALEERVLNELDIDGMLVFLSELVRIPSLGGEETPAQLKVAGWMRENGMEVDLWELDLEELRADPSYSAEIERDEGLGVVGFLGDDKGGRSLILNGHVDVVPPGPSSTWAFSPWDGGLEGGTIRGRGSLDMKGGLVAGLFAAKAIQDSGVHLSGKLYLQSVIGEEDGGVGTLAAVRRGYRADGAVIMEPTGLSICPAQAGVLNFRLSVSGRSAHGCVRNEGVSALEKFQVVHDALLALEASRNHNCSDALFRKYPLPLPLSVGKIEGGDWASSVPDWIRAEGRYGVGPEEGLEAAQKEFEEVLAGLGSFDPWFEDNPPEVEWWGGRFEPARIDSEGPVVKELQGALRDLGIEEPRLEGVPFGSDMRLLVNEGDTQTVLFGPGDIRQAHAANESVAVEELELTAKTLALMALRFCGLEDE
jgi:acetylornithine deacetylase